MTALTREAILAVNDLPLRAVEVPEWGGVVFVRSMSAAERDQWEAYATKDGSSPTESRARLLRLTVCDADGTPLFTDEDLEPLGRKNARALGRLFTAAVEVNRMSDKDEADLGKASAGAEPGSTPSTSPSASA